MCLVGKYENLRKLHDQYNLRLLQHILFGLNMNDCLNLLDQCNHCKKNFILLNFVEYFCFFLYM